MNVQKNKALKLLHFELQFGNLGLFPETRLYHTAPFCRKILERMPLINDWFAKNAVIWDNQYKENIRIILKDA